MRSGFGEEFGEARKDCGSDKDGDGGRERCDDWDKPREWLRAVWKCWEVDLNEDGGKVWRVREVGCMAFWRV